MKIITLEEHFQISSIKEALAKLLPDTQIPSPLASPLSIQLEDLGAGRLKTMDTMGVDVQVLSYTPSGMFTLPSFQFTLQVMGADRIMYAVDYPFLVSDHARTFLEHAPISTTDKAKIAHGNAEKVLKLSLNSLNR